MPDLTRILSAAPSADPEGADPCRVLLLAADNDWCRGFRDVAKQLQFRVKRLDSPVDALVHIPEFDPHLFVVGEYHRHDLALVDLCDAVRVPRQLRPLALVATTGVPLPRGEDLAELGVDEVLDVALPAERYAGSLVQLHRLTLSERRVLDRERDILDSLPEALLVVDEALIVWKVNRAFAALWGLHNAAPLRRYLGQPLLAMLASALAPSGSKGRGQALAAALEGALCSHRDSFRCREQLGPEERILAGQITRLRGRESHVLVALRDVTEHEQALAREARRERLATIGNLAVGVAHEIQNPNTFSRVNAANLRLILETLRPLLKDAAAAQPDRLAGTLSVNVLLETMEGAIAGVETASRRIAMVLDTLKGFGRSEGETPRRTDLAAVAAEAELLTRHVRGSRVTLTVDLPADAPPVLAVAAELVQVLVNLIENACQAFDFPPPQARGEAPGALRIVLEQTSGEELVLAVSDNGPGIDEALQAQIFRPYFTTRAQGEGTGLGLSLSSEILQRAGGDLRVRSRRGEGATFLLTLRRADVDVAAAAVTGEGHDV